MRSDKPFISIVIPVVIVGVVFGFGGGFLGSYIYDRSFQSEDRSVQQREQDAASDEEATIAAVNRVLPAVVDIVITKDIASFSNATGPNLFPFDDFFEFPFDFKVVPNGSEEEPEVREQEVGGGTGFIISSNGLVITNKHVVSDDDAHYTVVLNDGTNYTAEVLGRDPFNDLAVLKIDASGLPAVTLGNSDNLTIGQSVIAIGNSLGEYQNTVTKGVISGINRRVYAGGSSGGEIIEEAIQTDAAINPGNSGGPLINLQGEVVGVNTAISRSGQLIGFAIPVNTARQVTESVIEFGRIVRPWLGVRYVMNSEELADEQGYQVDYGAVLLSGDEGDAPAIIPESPAAVSGLQAGDIIVGVDDTRIDETHPLGRVIAKYHPGDTVVLHIVRDGNEIALSVTLEEFE